MAFTRGVVVWFVRSQADLRQEINDLLCSLQNQPLWIAWPKKTSRITSDMSEPFVRASGLAAGWVDYKVCSIDETWSGLLFKKRK